MGWNPHRFQNEQWHTIDNLWSEMSWVKRPLIPDIMEFILHSAYHGKSTEMQIAGSAVKWMRFAKWWFYFKIYRLCKLHFAQKIAANCIGLIMQNQGQFKHQIRQPECCLRLNLRNHQRNYASSKNSRTGVALHWAHFLVARIDPFIALRQFRMMKK